MSQNHASKCPRGALASHDNRELTHVGHVIDENLGINELVLFRVLKFAAILIEESALGGAKLVVHQCVLQGVDDLIELQVLRTASRHSREVGVSVARNGPRQVKLTSELAGSDAWTKTSSSPNTASIVRGFLN